MPQPRAKEDPICPSFVCPMSPGTPFSSASSSTASSGSRATRSEEHTSELQSQSNLVCRLLLEKKKNRLTRSYMLTLQPTPRSRARCTDNHCDSLHGGS